MGLAYGTAPVVNPDGQPGIQVHFDVGPDYEALYGNDAHDFIVPPGLARGGEMILEKACMPDHDGDPATPDVECQFPDFPGTVSWKIGYELYRDAPVADDGGDLSPEGVCSNAATCSTHRLRFDRDRLQFFHYMLYAHARGKPKELCLADDGGIDLECQATNPDFHVPSSSSGYADLPGADGMVTLGFWGNAFLGDPLVQASTTMHEMGHHFELTPRVSRNSRALFLVTAGWLFRGSEVASAGVEIIAGALLIARPNQVVTVLEKYGVSA